jgi:hypothetical protein
LPTLDVVWILFVTQAIRQTADWIAILVDQFVYPKLADDFFRLGGAVFVRGETPQVGLAVLLEQQRFDGFEHRLVKKRKAIVCFAVAEDSNEGRRHGAEFTELLCR